jgi:hypothetical protein
MSYIHMSILASTSNWPEYMASLRRGDQMKPNCWIENPVTQSVKFQMAVSLKLDVKSLIRWIKKQSLSTSLKTDFQRSRSIAIVKTHLVRKQWTIRLWLAIFMTYWGRHMRTPTISHGDGTEFRIFDCRWSMYCFEDSILAEVECNLDCFWFGDAVYILGSFICDLLESVAIKIE